MSSTEVVPSAWRVHNPIDKVKEDFEQRNQAQKVDAQVMTFNNVRNLMTKVDAHERILNRVAELEAQLVAVYEDVERLKKSNRVTGAK